MVLPRGLRKRWDEFWLGNIERGRLLIVSPFTKDLIRVTTDNATRKYETIISLNDQITVGFISPGGQLDKLLAKLEYFYV